MIAPPASRHLNDLLAYLEVPKDATKVVLVLEAGHVGRLRITRPVRQLDAAAPSLRLETRRFDIVPHDRATLAPVASPAPSAAPAYLQPGDSVKTDRIGDRLSFALYRDGVCLRTVEEPIQPEGQDIGIPAARFSRHYRPPVYAWATPDKPAGLLEPLCGCGYPAQQCARQACPEGALAAAALRVSQRKGGPQS